MTLSTRATALLTLTLLAAAAPAQADDALLSAGYRACMERAGGVTAAMLDCIGAEHRRQDQALNTAYRRLSASLAPRRAKALQAAQRAWIAYRDANVRFYADPEGGTLASVSAAAVALQETARRADELRRLDTAP